MAKEWECEECGADMRTENDPDGTGNLRFGHGWVCDNCASEIDDDFGDDDYD